MNLCMCLCQSKKKVNDMNISTHTISISVISCLIVLSCFAQVAQSAVMSSSNYSLQADSLNFGGARSNSGSYVLENTGGEVGTGDLDGVQNKIHAGYQQSDVVTAPSTSTPTPTITQTSSSGSRLPVNVLNFNAIPGNVSIFLSWQYPIDADIRSVRIVRSTVFFPVGISDGEVIFEGDALDVIDHDVVPGVLYYYALFARNSSGQYSSGVLAQARIAYPDEVIVLSTSTDPFANVPNALNVHPDIANLTLLDFDFIQDGKKIIHTGNTVVIDGKKNLTVRLAYNKVPQILKTIAISLADPNDQTKIFTFLLRVNDDETAYEATIAPLANIGDYRLHAIILDYKNQGLKRLEGNLRAVVFEGATTLLKSGGNYTWWIWVLIILVLIILVVLLSPRNRRNGNLGEDRAISPQ